MPKSNTYHNQSVSEPESVDCFSDKQGYLDLFLFFRRLKIA